MQAYHEHCELIAIIPCAGRGTRRLPDTQHRPKILLEHEGEPLFEHVESAGPNLHGRWNTASCGF